MRFFVEFVDESYVLFHETITLCFLGSFGRLQIIFGLSMIATERFALALICKHKKKNERLKFLMHVSF